MAHFALITLENIVADVIVGKDETELPDGLSSWETHYSTFNPELRAIQTSYNTFGGIHYTQDYDENGNPVGERYPSADQSKALRKNYAGIGYTYNEERDAFIPPKPFDSWVLNEDTCLWEPPIPYPNDGAVYQWDESLGDWVEVV